MRKLVMLGVCLALALQGVAQAGTVEKPCPMRKHGHVHATAVVKSVHDCCNDADTALKTGRACKMGQACPSIGAWVMNTLPAPSVPAVATSVVPFREPFALRVDPGGHWRPPALS